MIIFKDILTGDELASDGYKLIEVDDAVYEINTKKLPVKGEEFQLAGANASENPEEPNEDEGGDAGADVEMKYELELAFQLEPTSKFDKKAYGAHLKSYMKKVKEAMEKKGADAAKVKAFQTGASTYAKKVLSNIDDYDFFTGSSQDPDGMHVLVNYRDDGMTPYFVIWKYGLTEMKV